MDLLGRILLFNHLQEEIYTEHKLHFIENFTTRFLSFYLALRLKQHEESHSTCFIF